MDVLATIGNPDDTYVDRVTVKAVMYRNQQVLILNNGLLPGGGVNPGEDEGAAIHREIAEEIGASVETMQQIGQIIQYRDFLNKRYVVNGYVCRFRAFDQTPDPQDVGETMFEIKWLNLDDAKKLVAHSIKAIEKQPINNDASQGRLYNLLTTKILLDHFSVH